MAGTDDTAVPAAPSRSEGPKQRRSLVTELLGAHGRVEVSDLAARLGVAEETIRRDLRLMEAEGQLARTRGGAVSVQLATSLTQEGGRADAADLPLIDRVLSLLPSEGSVYLDGGTVAEQIAEKLPEDAELDLIVPGLDVAMVASMHPSVAVLSLGGQIDPETGMQTGEWARRTLLRTQPDLAVIVAGELGHGLELVARPETAAIRRLALRRAKRSLLVLRDSDEVGRRGFVVYATLPEFETVVVEEEAFRERRGILEPMENVVVVGAE
ncbi:DeoR/GlpR transcriptional regulator [Leucobacter sp. CSA1]|uniref:Lactose phosphotransferase system repressor n=1 Tax=Leucobacter chromiisoli TaxID=2796471 RepID=A0A934UTJ1_9MICO|nr:DeoR family transcriptional regulator [Leucobacter chromiisoli]MBK0418459.1 DeoR/GlpR transcriptional regulator [Leucobacter chromiisoli]